VKGNKKTKEEERGSINRKNKEEKSRKGT